MVTACALTYIAPSPLAEKNILEKSANEPVKGY